MNLPTPDPAFHWTAEPWGYALRCKPLSAIAQHAFTTKQLRLPRGGPRANPVAWTQVAASVNSGLEQLTLVRQVHGATVRSLKKGETTAREVAERPEADAIVSDVSGAVLAVQVADCVPILLADSQTGVAASIHAGWRGTCAAVAQHTLAVIAAQFAGKPSEIVVAIGPSIGPCCYDVGSNVLDAFNNHGWADPHIESWFTRAETGTLRLDLWKANRDQLVAGGVRADQIYVCGLCTKTHADVFESYRVDSERAGRMAAMIVVP
jgi:YfiH family protein